MAELSDLKVIAAYFNEGNGKRPLAVFSAEYKALTDQDKRELGEGIRNGTLTY